MLFFRSYLTVRLSLVAIAMHLTIFLIIKYYKHFYILGHMQVDLTLNVDSVLIYRHLFRVPEKTVKMNGISIWKACNTFLWKGNIVQDTPEIIAKAMKKNSEVLYKNELYSGIRLLTIMIVPNIYSNGAHR